MKWLCIFVAAGVATVSGQSSDSTLRFAAPPTLERFPDGAVEWSAAISCSNPFAWRGASLILSLDRDLDGFPEAKPDSVALGPGHCDAGQANLARTLFPGRPALLVASIRRGDSLADQAFALTGETGSLLALRRFCARPEAGETEWVQLENRGETFLDLGKIRIQGRLLGPGSLKPGSILILGPDSSAMRGLFPSLAAMAIPSWKSLRNTGDTLRLTWEGAVLDSALFGTPFSEPRESCLQGGGTGQPSSTPFALEITPKTWNRAAGALEISIQAPVDAGYSVQVFDLDGHGLCTLIPHGQGSRRFVWDGSGCPSFPARGGAILLHLQHRGTSPLRRLVALRP